MTTSSAARIVWAILRAAVPLVLLVGGIVSLGYGVSRHTAEVSQEQEIEIDLMPPQVGPPGVPGVGVPGMGPPGMGPPGMGPQPGGFGPPEGPGFGDPMAGGMPPWMAPPPELAKVKKKIVISQATAEPELVREVTFGGVVRLSSGVLRRTYSGTPPSLCPT